MFFSANESVHFSREDCQFMAEAIRAGESHNGRTGDNPSVGAVLVKGNQIIGQGVTAIGGRPHAETQALTEAGKKAQGATLYVTLEPCCHFGKTPPCTEALIKAGVARVVIAVTDPDSRVRGKGIAQLREAGIKADTGCLADGAVRQLAPYLCRRRFNRPFITAKLALSQDGCIGIKGEGQIALTGNKSREAAHALRAAHDAVFVGIGTALADNPRLDCRFLQNSKIPPHIKNAVYPNGGEFKDVLPARIIIDTNLRLPLSSHLAQTAEIQPVWLLCGENADRQKEMALMDAGCRILRCPIQAAGKIDLAEAAALLLEKDIRSVFAEGGAEIIQALWNQGMADQLILFHTPKFIGEEGYKAPDFGSYAGYEKIAEQIFEADKAEVYLYLLGAQGLLGETAE